MEHIMDVCDENKNIIEKIEIIKLEIVKKHNVGYKSQDARMVALDNIQLDLSATSMWIYAYCSLVNKCRNEAEFLKSVSSRLSLSDTEVYMFEQLQQGLITSILFKMDNLFFNILKDWNLDVDELIKKGYYKKSELILEKTVPSEKKDLLNTLTILANIRNSLHNNGIHRQRRLKAKINNIDYVFETGKPVECASWELIVNALSGNIDVLSKILLSDTVDWKNEIRDDFSAVL